MGSILQMVPILYSGKGRRHHLRARRETSKVSEDFYQICGLNLAVCIKFLQCTLDLVQSYPFNGIPEVCKLNISRDSCKWLVTQTWQHDITYISIRVIKVFQSFRMSWKITTFGRAFVPIQTPQIFEEHLYQKLPNLLRKQNY